MICRPIYLSINCSTGGLLEERFLCVISGQEMLGLLVLALIARERLICIANSGLEMVEIAHLALELAGTEVVVMLLHELTLGRLFCH